MISRMLAPELIIQALFSMMNLSIVTPVPYRGFYFRRFCYNFLFGICYNIIRAEIAARRVQVNPAQRITHLFLVVDRLIYQIMSLIFVAVLGWFAGVTVNYISDVLPRQRRLTAPFCLSCDSTQTLLNYLLWPRKCESCGAKPSARTWFIEILFIILSVWLWMATPEQLGYAVSLILLLYFGVVVVIDVEHRLILHPVSLVGVALGLGIGIWLHGIKSTLIGGAVGFGAMLLLYYLGFVFVRLMSRWRGRDMNEVALGYGDVNLAGVIGLLLGWPGIVAGLVFAILLGGAASLLYLIIMALRRRYSSDMVLPYGPFLIASAVLLLFFRSYLL